jgi:hypothetical protein
MTGVCKECGKIFETETPKNCTICTCDTDHEMLRVIKEELKNLSWVVSFHTLQAINNELQILRKEITEINNTLRISAFTDKQIKKLREVIDLKLCDFSDTPKEMREIYADSMTEVVVKFINEELKERG